MFGIGFSELVLIGLILILFIKPEDLPKFFRSLGKIYGQMKKAYNDVVSVKDKILKEIDEAATLEENAKGQTVPLRPEVPPLPQKTSQAQLEAPKNPEPGKTPASTAPQTAPGGPKNESPEPPGT
jgi:sec-independent protein translocase protein TatB